MGPSVLYLRGGAVRSLSGGADLVSSSAKRMLDERFGQGSIDCIYMDELEPPPGRALVLARAASGRYPTYGKAASALVKAGAKGGASLLFVDQSVYGLACAEAKAVAANIACIVLFHNDERRYYLRRAAQGGKVHDLLLLPAICRAERAALRRAELCIALSERDARELEEDYGRRPELIMPPALEDRGGAKRILPIASGKGLRMLFVGSAFAPNVEGMRWFVREVLPRVPGSLTIAGSGFEAYRAELGSERVEVLGFVPDLSTIYAEADSVVSPVFWGSGIKIKTAEAFMYGMPFVGSGEALEGYDCSAAGALRADDPESFASALKVLECANERSGRSAAAREYFLANLSYAVAKGKLDAAFKTLGF